MRLALIVVALCARATSAWAHAERPTNRAPEPLQYDPTDVLQTRLTPSGFLTIHYTLEGRNAVDLARIDRIAAVYDRALAAATSTLGFDPPQSDELALPDNGGDGTVDIFVLDTGEARGQALLEGCVSDGAIDCWGYIDHPVSEIDDESFAGIELFRLILGGYRITNDRQLELGLASWSIGDEEAFEGYLASARFGIEGRFGMALGRPALFFAFLSDRYDAALIRSLWQSVAINAQDWTVHLDRLLAERGSTLAAEFTAFAVANVSRAAPQTAAMEKHDKMWPWSVLYYPIASGQTVVATDARLVLMTVDQTVAVINATGESLPAFSVCVGSAEDIEDCGKEGGCRCARAPSDSSSGLFLLIGMAAFGVLSICRRQSRSN